MMPLALLLSVLGRRRPYHRLANVTACLERGVGRIVCDSLVWRQRRN